MPPLLRVPAAALLGALARASGRRLGLVLLYHRVTEGDAPPGRLVPTVRAHDFERQLRLLRAWYRVVPLEELHAAVRRRRRGGRVPVALTFDDDLPEHLAVVAPRLRAAGVAATFFLCGASLEAPRPFWWERLEDAADPPALLGATGARSVEELAERIKTTAPADRARIEALLAEHGRATDHDALDAPRVRALADGFDVGFHTREHPFLPALDDAGLEQALTHGREELERLTGRPLTSIAYPHGGVDERTGAAARAAGFRLGLTTAPTGVGDDPLLLGRAEPAPAPLGLYWLRIERALRRRG